MPSKYSQRFQELNSQLETIEANKKTKYDSFSNRNQVDVESNDLLNWQVKAESLLVSACGANSTHLQAFKEAAEHGMYTTNHMRLKRMSAVFRAAQEDFDGGYLSSVRALVQAEVFTSELEHATALLDAGYKAPAAVVAGVVLETGLRELCDRQNIGHSKLDKMNADLAKSATYNLLQQKRITTLAQIRNDAAHGKNDQFTEADVKSMITDIERFLADHLS
jgi:hypothetical protein